MEPLRKGLGIVGIGTARLRAGSRQAVLDAFGTGQLARLCLAETVGLRKPGVHAFAKAVTTLETEVA